MKTIQLTLTDTEYDRMQRCRVGHISVRSDEYIVKYALRLWVNKKLTYINKGKMKANKKRIDTISKAHKIKNKENAKQYLTKKI